MLIGVPKEIKSQEHRVAMLPAASDLHLWEQLLRHMAQGGELHQPAAGDGGVEAFAPHRRDQPVELRDARGARTRRASRPSTSAASGTSGYR